jgi:hypothetical protein
MWPDDFNSITPKHLPHAIESIALARRCKVPTILKRAMYELARDDEFADRVDDECDMEEIARNYSVYDDFARTLEEKDIFTIFRARDQMHKYTFDYAREAPYTHQECVSPGLWSKILATPIIYNCIHDPILALILLGNTALWCKPSLFKNGSFLNENGEPIWNCHDAMLEKDLEEARLKSIDWQGLQVCEECISSIREWALEQIDCLWNQLLPQDFGLPN